ANLWWCDLRYLPTAISLSTLLVSGTLLLFFGIRVPQAGWRLAATGLSAALVALVALFNAAQFYLLLGKGLITSGLPFAFSLFVATGLSLVALGCVRAETAEVRRFDGIRLALLTLLWAG